MAEHFRIGREFQIETRRRRNRLEKDLTNKIWLQQDALRALPEALRIQAEIIDEEPPPPDRPWANWATPPIKDFDPKNFLSKKGGEDYVDELSGKE